MAVVEQRAKRASPKKLNSSPRGTVKKNTSTGPKSTNELVFEPDFPHFDQLKYTQLQVQNYGVRIQVFGETGIHLTDYRNVCFSRIEQLPLGNNTGVLYIGCPITKEEAEKYLSLLSIIGVAQFFTSVELVEKKDVPAFSGHQAAHHIKCVFDFSKITGIELVFAGTIYRTVAESIATVRFFLWLADKYPSVNPWYLFLLSVTLPMVYKNYNHMITDYGVDVTTFVTFKETADRIKSVENKPMSQLQGYQRKIYGELIRKPCIWSEFEFNSQIKIGMEKHRNV